MTFFDRLANLRMEFDRLCLEGSPRTGKDIVKAFSGVGSIDDKQMRTLVQCAITVMRLPIAVIDEIGDVRNGEHPTSAFHPRNSKSLKFQVVMT